MFRRKLDPFEAREKWVKVGQERETQRFLGMIDINVSEKDRELMIHSRVYNELLVSIDSIYDSSLFYITYNDLGNKASIKNSAEEFYKGYIKHLKVVKKNIKDNDTKIKLDKDFKVAAPEIKKMLLKMYEDSKMITQEEFDKKNGFNKPLGNK